MPYSCLTGTYTQTCLRRNELVDVSNTGVPESPREKPQSYNELGNMHSDGGGKGEERKSERREEILFLEFQVLQKASGNSVTKIIDSMDRKGLISSLKHPSNQ